jgi:hypothetical protein
MPSQIGFGRRNSITVGAAVRWHDEESQLVVIVMMVDLLLCLLPEQLVLYCTYPVCIAEKRGFFPKATSQKCCRFAEKKTGLV